MCTRGLQCHRQCERCSMGVGSDAGNPALKMQHWLKDISSGREPFSETFENMLRKGSVKQPDHKPVSETLARKEAGDAAEHSVRRPPAREHGRGAEAHSHGGHADARQPHAQPGASLRVGPSAILFQCRGLRFLPFA